MHFNSVVGRGSYDALEQIGSELGADCPWVRDTHHLMNANTLEAFKIHLKLNAIRVGGWGGGGITNSKIWQQCVTARIRSSDLYAG